MTNQETPAAGTKHNYITLLSKWLSAPESVQRDVLQEARRLAGPAVSRRGLIGALAVAPAGAALLVEPDAPPADFADLISQRLAELDALMKAHVADGECWAVWLTHSSGTSMARVISFATGKDATILFDATEARS